MREIGDEHGAHGSRGADLLCFHGGCGSGGAEAAAPGRKRPVRTRVPRRRQRGIGATRPSLRRLRRLRYGADCFDLFGQFTDDCGYAAVSRYPQGQPDVPAVATSLGRES